jgi:hypothetical protein
LTEFEQANVFDQYVYDGFEDTLKTRKLCRRGFCVTTIKFTIIGQGISSKEAWIITLVSDIL